MRFFFYFLIGTGGGRKNFETSPRRSHIPTHTQTQPENTSRFARRLLATRQQQQYWDADESLCADCIQTVYSACEYFLIRTPAVRACGRPPWICDRRGEVSKTFCAPSAGPPDQTARDSGLGNKKLKDPALLSKGAALGAWVVNFFVPENFSHGQGQLAYRSQ